MITVEGVSVELGGATVLSDVSVSVGEGQFLALVGPNGAGKTTLLRVCNGALPADEGTVTLDGAAVESLSAREISRAAATVPQETHLAFDFDVRDVVAMGRTPHRSRFGTADDTDHEAVERALERTDTARFADRSVGGLSGGERQRVLVARALAQSTPALLLDEPTASLDINHQVRTLALARELADEGKTVVAAIHDLELAARFCDEVALLSEGRLLDTGPPESVLSADRLESAFGVRTAVSTNPVTGTRAVTPLSDAPPEGRRVHVLGGGERAARLLGRLVDAGIEVTAGVLPEGDAALATAGSVAREVVAAPPFRPVDGDRLAAAADLIETADATVLAAPVEGANAELAARSRPLFAVEGTDPPADATVVPEADLLEALETPPKEGTAVRGP
ncbi:heme ABC transporter ATP-binding protein [Natronomonas marina]|uniref:heme ABC transporter ATP-binding protein n=1 Tax=Natronomonas marina TaxID=2961939 RepID=UPI0020C9F85D|nr:heme ABC transporter ATP-binding protein [Natronomonas marina]